MTDRRDKLDAPGPESELYDLLMLLRRSIELELRVCSPARVVSYNPATQTADVTLELLPVRELRDGTEVPDAPIKLVGIPVRWPRTAAGYQTLPLNAGDLGHVLFSDRCLSKWLAAGSPVDPVNGRAHSLADAFFEPGLSPTPIATPTDQTAHVIDGTLVKLGRTATDFALLGTAFLGHLNGFLTALAAVVGGDPTANATAINAISTAATVLQGQISSDVSTKVQIE
jgi:hypothetical protein